MQKRHQFCVTTEETEDGSSQQPHNLQFINSFKQTDIIDVWADNFQLQMQRISTLTKKYNIISIDTQFPSIQTYNQKNDYFSGSEQEKYTKLAKNVNNTSLIQLGMSLADEQGNVPSKNICWQFNFKFQGDIEEISPSSAELLKKAGINFEKLRSNGISYKTFTHEFIKSGLLLSKRNKWIVFHGGFDFAYLLKLIKNQHLPKSIEDFYKSIKIYFPHKIDLKNIIQKNKNLKRYGLSKLADSILCRRIGPEHQAGSDALLTMQCHFKLRNQFQSLFQNTYQNCIYGIGSLNHKQVQTSAKNYCQQYAKYMNLSMHSNSEQNNYSYLMPEQGITFYQTAYQNYFPTYFGYETTAFLKGMNEKDESY